MEYRRRHQKKKRSRMCYGRRKRIFLMSVSFIGVIVLLIIGIYAVLKAPDRMTGVVQSPIGQDMLGQSGKEKTGDGTPDNHNISVSEFLSVGMDCEGTSDGIECENRTDKEEATDAVIQAEEQQRYLFNTDSNTVTNISEEVNSSNVILVNESTDTIAAAKGAKERINPASMTKVLTVLVAAESIKEENLDDTFTMTTEITDYAYFNDCSSVGFLDGEVVTVRDLFYGTILPSGGDAAIGLATYIAGSHETFVEMMNEKLEELGLSESAHFTNCVGLYDENHYCTVYDMAVIMKAAMKNELCREFLSAKRYTTESSVEHPEGISISNWFLRRIEDKDAGGEVLCAKTGYVVESKNCAVSYGTFAGGTPYICVTTGARSSWRCIYDHVEIYNRYVS